MGDEHQYTPSAGKSGPQGQPDDRVASLIRQSSESWQQSMRENPLNRLRYLDAKLARIGLDSPEIPELKARAGELIRELPAEDVLGDPGCVGLVRQLFGERGVQRLRERVKR